MPTIEIASINSLGLGLNQADFDVAIIEENILESHRGLFYNILLEQKGCIVHLGNPDFKKDKEGMYFADAVVDWRYQPEEKHAQKFEYGKSYEDSLANQHILFKFHEQYVSDIDRLLKIALEKSPVRKVYFLTDYQFGPEKTEIEVIQTISNFWQRHNNQGLRLNTLYEVYEL